MLKQQIATTIKVLIAVVVVLAGIGLFLSVNLPAGATTDASTTVPDISTSTTVASPDPVPADGTTTMSVTVTLNASDGNPIGGATVSLASTPSSGITVSSPVATSSSGVATFTVSSTAVGKFALTATDTSSTSNGTSSGTSAPTSLSPVTVGFYTPGEKSLSTISISTNSVPADGSSTTTVTVTLIGKSGPIVGHSVTVGGSPTVQSTPTGISATTQVTNSQGVEVLAVTDTQPEIVDLTATDTTDGAVISPSPAVAVAFSPVGEAASSTVVASEASVPADGTTAASITVTLSSDAGLIHNGDQVELTQDSLGTSAINGGTVGGSATVTTPTSGSTEGTAVFTVTDSSAQGVVYTATDITDHVVLSQTASIDFLPGPLNQSNSSVTASPSSVTADGVSSSTVDVLLRDANKQPIAGKTVSIAAYIGTSTTVSTTATITAISAVTSSSGVASFTITDTAVETLSIVATDVTDGITLSTPAPLSFTTGPAVSSTSSASVENANQTANGSIDQITLTFKDAEGHVVAGDPITLSPQNGSSTIVANSSDAVNSTGQVVTNSSGSIVFNVSDSHAELVSYIAFDTTSGATVSGINVNFVAGAPSASVSTVVASPASVQSGSDSTVTVTALDSEGNALSGATVTLSNNVGSAVLEQGLGTGATATTAVTNSAGVASFSVTDPNPAHAVFTASVSATVIPTGSGAGVVQTVTLNETAPVSFTGSPTSTNSTIQATPTSVPANGTSTATIIVTLQDALGDPVSNQDVTLRAGSGSSLITGSLGNASSGPSGSNGQVSFQVSDASVQDVVYSALDTTDNVTLAGTVTVEFTGQPSPTTSTVSVSPNTVQVGGTTNIVVTLRDSLGNPVSGKVVFVQGVTGTGAASSATVSTIQGTTGSNGEATFSATDSVPESVIFEATDESDSITLPSSSSDTVAFTALPTEASTSTLVASPSTVPADGITASSLTVTLTDGSGTPIPISSDAVTVSESTGGHAKISTGVISSTNSNQETFSITDLYPETVIFTATDSNGVVIDETASITFTPSASEASNSSVTASPATVPADGSSSTSITVTLKDSSGNPVSGHQVTLSNDGTGVVESGQGTGATPTTATTNTNGVASFTATALDALGETVVFSATDTTDSNPVIQTATVDFEAPPSEASQSSVSVSPPSVPADGTSVATVSVTLLSASGQPISGHDVSLSPQGSSSAVVTPVSGIATNGSGQVYFNVTDTSVQTVTFNVIDTTASVTLGRQATVIFQKPSTEAAQSTISASPVLLAGNGSASSTVTVTLVNNSLPVVGADVTLQTASNSAVIQATSPITNSSGVATFSVSDTSAESVVLSAYDSTNSVAITASVTLTFTAVPSEQQSSTLQVNSTTAPDNGITPIVATVTLMNGTTPIANHEVALSISAGSHAVVNPEPSVTGVNGEATFSVTDLSAEQVTLKATDLSNSISIAQSVTVTYVVPIPAVTGISPNQGPSSGGTTVEIVGSGFVSGDSVIFGAGNPGSILTSSPTSMEVTSPAHVAGTVDVQVVGTGGASSTSSADEFTYVSPPQVPTLNTCAKTLPAGEVVGMARTLDGNGYWVVDSAGDVAAYGNAGCYGTLSGTVLNKPIVAIAGDPVTGGYWLVGADGGIFSFNAPFYGSTGAITLNAPIVDMVATSSGKGYYLVASDGGIFAFGDAAFYGSMGGRPLNAPIIGIAVTPGGGGYWLAGSDGGIFAFGNAQFYGSMGAKPLNKPIVGIASDLATGGYWLVGADGGVFSFDAQYFGSTGAITLNRPIVGMQAQPNGNGYRFVASDGGIFDFGSADFFGSAVG